MMHHAAMLAVALTLAAALPAVGLNHFYVVLDQATYDAILASDFVTEELAAADGGLGHSGKPGRGAPSLYLRGRDTYIELLAPRNRSNLPIGACGLALSPDDAGALDKLEAPLRRVAPQTQRRTVPLDAGEHPIPWYDIATIVAPEDARLAFWVSQYHPEFARQVLQTTSVDRHSYLARLYDPERLLENVVELSLALTASEASTLRKQLRALGFHEKVTGDEVLLDGAGLRLHVVTQAQSTGAAIVSATMALRRPTTRHLELGTSRIDAEGRRAVWRFGR
jgi:hypothetical protein